MPQPNILLVTVDSLRADYVDGREADTPNLNRLAHHGKSCEAAISQGPFTTFSMPSLFTSRFPSQLTRIDFVEGVQGVLIDGTPTIQHHLSENGYTTAGIHSNPLLSRHFGFDAGFDHFDDGFGTIRDRMPERLRLLANKFRRVLSRTAYTPAEDITDAALEWLTDDPPEPWFLWVHYMDVHGPYQPTHGRSYVEKFRAEYLWRRAVHSPEDITPEERDRLKTAYIDEVEYTDAEIGRLFDGVGEDGGGLCITVTADHGEEFGEHGSYSHDSKLYDELIRVPLLIDAPAGTRVAFRDGPTPLLDVSPTLVDIGGGMMPGAEGRSLIDKDGDRAGTGLDPASSGTAAGTESVENPDVEVVHTDVFAEAKLPPDFTACVRTGAWKYLVSPGSTELYDLQHDPRETECVLNEYPDIAKGLRNRLATHRERCVEDGPNIADVALDTNEIDERLRRLGYLE